MPIFELINPSDPYTFEATDLTTAGVAVYMLSSKFGARQIDTEEDERTPILFGWEQWFADRNVDDEWVETHKKELAQVWRSFLIGDYERRRSLQELMSLLEAESPQKLAEWKQEQQDRNRSSMSQIGEVAYRYADRFDPLVCSP